MNRAARFSLCLIFGLIPLYASSQKDVTSQVSISASGLVLNRTTNTFNSVVTVKNVSDSALEAPVWLSVGNLGSVATLGNASGTAPNGDPYLVLAATSIAPGESAPSVVAQFRDPTRFAFTPTFRVWETPAASGPVTFHPGVSTPLVTQSIGASGGTISVSGTGTALDGTIVSFPVGAVTSNTQVTLSLNAGTMNPIEGIFPGFSLELDVTGSHVFNQPVSITVPFTASNATPVPYYVAADGTLRPMQIVSIDRQHGTFTFQTFHASLFSWLWQLIFGTPGVLTTGYTPGNNGFQVVNYGSTYQREGECLGMTAFSLWYWLNYNSQGNFYPRFMGVVGTDSTGASLRGQNVIATRAFTSIAQVWTAYYSGIVGNQESLSQAARYASIYNIVANTEAPVLIYLYHSNGSAGAHSVLAYAINDNSKQIAIYDPNLPGAPHTIQYSASSGFQQYCNGACYDGIVYNGDGSLNLTEPYTNILSDANNNFDNSGGAVIDLTSQTSGQIVDSFFQTLTGTVHSGQLLITKLTAIVGSTEFSTDVGLDGNFSIAVTLTEGVNHIKFRTEGKNASGVLVPSSNNFDTQDFTLNAVVPRSVILMTLTWNTNDTDLDTYVIDPTGDYSSYYHKVTADGGTLDQDVTTGYGPEHWTLLTTDTVRYNQPYRFRVHYYSDHGNHGPSNYVVTIELYDGTSRQQTYTYTGALVANDPSNDLPTDTGSDWANIATITLTQASSNGSLRSQSPSAEKTSSGLNITIPVPSLADRVQLKKR